MISRSTLVTFVASLLLVDKGLSRGSELHDTDSTRRPVDGVALATRLTSPAEPTRRCRNHRRRGPVACGALGSGARPRTGPAARAPATALLRRSRGMGWGKIGAAALACWIGLVIAPAARSAI